MPLLSLGLSDGNVILVSGSSNESHGYCPIMPSRAFPGAWGGNRISIHAAALDSRGGDGRGASCSKGRLGVYEFRSSVFESAPLLTSESQPFFNCGRLTSLDVDASSNLAVIAGEDGMSALLDVTNLGGAPSFVTPYSGIPLSGVAFQGLGGQIFATCGSSPQAQLQVWDSRQGVCVAKCRHPSPVFYTCVANRPLAPEIFIAGTSSGELAAWDTRVCAEPFAILAGWAPQRPGYSNLRVESESVSELIFHPDRPRFILASTENGKILLWDGESNDPEPEKVLDLPGQSFSGIAFEGETNSLYCATFHGRIINHGNLEACELR